MRFFHHFAKSKLENFHLSVSEIVGLFISTLTATDKYCLCSRENLPPPIQLQLSKKQKCFLNFLLDISNLRQILKSLKENVTITHYVFSKLGI